MKIKLLLAILLLSFGEITIGQETNKQNAIVEAIIKEAEENSQLEELGHELLDVIGPRLVGTPQMQEAHNWAIEKYKAWEIPAENEKWGEWRGWERGITHVDMIYPRVQTLDGMQLAWSASTSDKGIKAEVIVVPIIEDANAFQNWLKTVKGKIVLVSMKEETGRPDYNWKEFATKESFEKMKKERSEALEVFSENIIRAGFSNNKERVAAIENAGAAAVVQCYWSKGFGVNKIFGARTKKIPEISLELEDYTMLYRLVESGHKPEIKIVSKSKELGSVPTFNTIAQIKGTENPEEYVILSAHFDSWDGGTGATDNGTGTLIMMEAMRILKKTLPNPKRTILVGHWGSEEQGLNGSGAFVQDHPEIVENVQALFNQDNGTGRVINISGAGYLNSYEYISRWLNEVPSDIRKHITTDFPGIPSGGGSDNGSFNSAGSPAFRLSSLSWSYENYTWHTNRDTYDKIVFDDVRNNVILTAILAYMASEDGERTSAERRVMPLSKKTGKPIEWPKQRTPDRNGGMD